MKTKLQKQVESYFNDHQAKLNIHCPEQETIYQYLSLLIEEHFLEIPHFCIQSYSCMTLDPWRTIHNFVFQKEEFDETLDELCLPAIRNSRLLNQDDCQPKPMYTLFMGTLYITIILEA